MKRENLKILPVLIYDAIATLYWRAAWENWLWLSTCKSRERATLMLNKAQNMKADWCTNKVRKHADAMRQSWICRVEAWANDIHSANQLKEGGE